MYCSYWQKIDPQDCVCLVHLKILKEKVWFWNELSGTIVCKVHRSLYNVEKLWLSCRKVTFVWVSEEAGKRIFRLSHSKWSSTVCCYGQISELLLMQWDKTFKKKRNFFDDEIDEDLNSTHFKSHKVRTREVAFEPGKMYDLVSVKFIRSVLLVVKRKYSGARLNYNLQ